MQVAKSSPVHWSPHSLVMVVEGKKDSLKQKAAFALLLAPHCRERAVQSQDQELVFYPQHPHCSPSHPQA